MVVPLKNSSLFICRLHVFQFCCFVLAFITKTCLCNFDPLKPHFYIVKLGFTGVYIIFLISAKNIDCGYSLEPPRRGGSNEYPQSMFRAEIWKISEFFFIWKLSVFGGEIFSIFESACFRNGLLFFFRYLGKSILRDCGQFWMPSFIFIWLKLCIVFKYCYNAQFCK